MEEVLVAEDDDTCRLNKRDERTNQGCLELRYLDSEFDHLLELSSFLDPRFKLSHGNNKTKVSEEIEKKMSQMIERSEDDDSATNFCIMYSCSSCLLYGSL